MDYLLYVAHDAESLQFFLWYRDYCRRFDALEPAQKQLSPEWRFDSNNTSPSGWPLQSDEKEVMVSTTPSQPAAVRSFSRLGRHTPQQNSVNLHNGSLDFEDFPQAPPHARSESWTSRAQPYEKDTAESDAKSYVSRSSRAHQNRTSLQAANSQVGLKWQGCKFHLIFWEGVHADKLQSRYNLSAPKSPASSHTISPPNHHASSTSHTQHAPPSSTLFNTQPTLPPSSPQSN